MPPILDVADLTEDIFEDIRDASKTYWHGYGYTHAFDKLRTVPERNEYLLAMLKGQVDGEEAARKLREWLLAPWRSVRSLGEARLPQMGRGLTAALEVLRSISTSTDLSRAVPGTIEAMGCAFDCLHSCPGVGGTVASKILSALRPDLFMIWDIPIARAYGLDRGVAGYGRFLQLMASATRTMRAMWGQRTPSLEEYLHPDGREWRPLLAKFLDEWHWVRITRRHVRAPER